MIARSEKVTPTTWRISVETPGPVIFRAGQYFEWVLPGIAPNRVYSAANAPGGDCIDFLVRIYADGKVGSHIQQNFSVGRTFSIVGPFGHFALSRNDWRPAVCIAGGTGLAPMLSVLSEAVANGDKRRFIFFFGARNREELCCLDEIEKLSRQLPSFTFVPVLSHEAAGSDWRGERGMVTDVLARKIPDLFGLEAYLCGPPAMIDAAIEILDAAGVPPQDIRVDRFAPAK
jgi:NAD(P)H-flavin reductase